MLPLPTPASCLLLDSIFPLQLRSLDLSQNTFEEEAGDELRMLAALTGLECLKLANCRMSQVRCSAGLARVFPFNSKSWQLLHVAGAPRAAQLLHARYVSPQRWDLFPQQKASACRPCHPCCA